MSGFPQDYYKGLYCKVFRIIPWVFPGPSHAIHCGILMTRYRTDTDNRFTRMENNSQPEAVHPYEIPMLSHKQETIKPNNMKDENDNEVELPSPILPQHMWEDEEVDANDKGAAIVRNIANFLSLGDAAAIASGFGPETPTVDNWAIPGGTPYQWPSAKTPPTPSLVSVSPNEDFGFGSDTFGMGDPAERKHNTSLMIEDSESVVEISHDRRRRTNWAQEKLACAVFSHPDSLRSYCVDAYLAAKEVQLNQSISIVDGHDSPETLVEPSIAKNRHQKKSHSDDRILFLSAVVDHILNNVPLSVALDLLDGCWEVSLDTSFAALRITSMTFHGIVNAVLHFVGSVWDRVNHLNPLVLIHAIVSRPFNAMGKTTEVFVSGIQSVATGVGSASSMAFHRLSAKTASSSNLAQTGILRRNRLGSPKLNKKLIKKLSTMHSAASVIAYTELADDTGGLSKRAKNRVQRMMHYDVSLRPFVATVKLPNDHGGQNSYLENSDRSRTSSSQVHGSEFHEGEASSTTSSPESPFMCTPQSFPPTPKSRRDILAKGTRFADNVIFLARDQLRVHDALESNNERTREMAVALTQGKRLAVFDADDASAGVDLTCGQHVATKVGNMLYCSTRSMVPILRNCFVYFEMTVLPKMTGNLIPQAIMATLSIGLSTKEMPPNTLVGAWKGSVGLCTTGQLLTAGQWCSPVDPSLNSFGDRATVGCLVCLDDGSAFETWDGVMVTAAVTFNVNQRIVSPPVSTLPMTAATTVGGEIYSTPVGSPTSAEIGAVPSTPPTHIIHAPPAFTLPLLVPAEEELYPTVTLHSPGTAVMCRFSVGDVIATSREVIGAPLGVAVYTVDGTLILSETD